MTVTLLASINGMSTLVLVVFSREGAYTVDVMHVAEIPRSKAAKGQKVPKNQLKNSVIKAIDILISSDSTNRSTILLKSTKSELLNEIQQSGGVV